MTNPKERIIEEFDKKFDYDNKFGVMWQGEEKDNPLIEIKQFIEKSLDQYATELLKSILPQERKEDFHHPEWEDGYDSAVRELKQNAKERGIGI